jgi:hypothetical protein
MDMANEPIILDGKRFYTVREFSSLIHKSEHTVYRLISEGSLIRKLKARYVAEKPLIEADELTDFPFTGAGRYPLKDVYHYTENGVSLPCPLCSEWYGSGKIGSPHGEQSDQSYEDGPIGGLDNYGSLGD